jgi:hypothetical protein
VTPHREVTFHLGHNLHQTPGGIKASDGVNGAAISPAEEGALLAIPECSLFAAHLLTSA